MVGVRRRARGDHAAADGDDPGPWCGGATRDHGDRDERPVRRRVVADGRLGQVDEEVVGRDDRPGRGRGGRRDRGHRHDIEERHDQGDGRDHTRRDGPCRTAVVGSRVLVGHPKVRCRRLGRRSSRRRCSWATMPSRARSVKFRRTSRTAARCTRCPRAPATKTGGRALMAPAATAVTELPTASGRQPSAPLRLPSARGRPRGRRTPPPRWPRRRTGSPAPRPRRRPGSVAGRSRRPSVPSAS